MTAFEKFIQTVKGQDNYWNRIIFLFAAGGFCIPYTYWNKFIYSEKVTKFCEISTKGLSYVVMVKSTVEISQNDVAFSEYMDFISIYLHDLLQEKQFHQNYFHVDFVEKSWLENRNEIITSKPSMKEPKILNVLTVPKDLPPNPIWKFI